MTAFVLMTAMPPTKGHLHLMQFAGRLAGESCVVICTQPGEPYVAERVAAVVAAARTVPGMRVRNIHQTVPQRPEDAPDFWEMWRGFLAEAGCVGLGDLVVASEDYGAPLAAVTGARFMPYDLDRSITDTRGTWVREDPLGHFADMMVEFQPAIRRRVTLHGAESTGKTTLSRALATRLGGHWLPEWARPYLEHLDSPLVDEQRMRDIWAGQRALQAHGHDLVDRPFVVQDTDLFATAGYWELWRPGECPPELVADALADTSDLYLVPRSNVPFEPDPLRYGGDRRETPDSYWVEQALNYGLHVAVLESADPTDRIEEAAELVLADWHEHVRLGYERVGNS